MSCSGDEGAASQSLRRRAFSRALKVEHDLTVDLRELGFADVTLMLDLVSLVRRLRQRGKRVIVYGAQPQVLRLIEMMGVHRLPSVRMAGPSPA
ncbi:MAG: STAS domain-containing protein [Solirubrobacterales bacterium]|nr:STAS domain-containing protein [Solirubrobacterales bacterium]